jgi:hypothetical protein
MKHLIITCVAIMAITTIFSCKKKDDVQPTETAKLTITTPVMHQTYHTGDTVRILGTATNVTNLHGYHVAILNSNSDTLFYMEKDIHAVSLSIDTMWVNTVTAAQELNVIVSSPINHDGDEIKKEIPIMVQP